MLNIAMAKVYQINIAKKFSSLLASEKNGDTEPQKYDNFADSNFLESQQRATNKPKVNSNIAGECSIDVNLTTKKVA